MKSNQMEQREYREMLRLLAEEKKKQLLAANREAARSLLSQVSHVSTRKDKVFV